ncbi:MAG: hypothetical protein OEM29_06795 [Thermoplasmata archaeon]|nr:hypothetical protein [Thermoplasmata archaeon]
MSFAPRSTGTMRICNRCRQETEAVFCPRCRVLTSLPKERATPITSAQGETFECTIWQGTNRSRGIEVRTGDRDKYFSKDQDMVVFYVEGLRTIAKLGAGFWKKPAIIKRALGEDGKDQLAKFLSKHHLLPPEQSIKEKGIVDTLIFEVVVPSEEFKISNVERAQGDDGKDVD